MLKPAKAEHHRYKTSSQLTQLTFHDNGANSLQFRCSKDTLHSKKRNPASPQLSSHSSGRANSSHSYQPKHYQTTQTSIHSSSTASPSSKPSVRISTSLTPPTQSAPHQILPSPAREHHHARSEPMRQRPVEILPPMGRYFTRLSLNIRLTTEALKFHRET